MYNIDIRSNVSWSQNTTERLSIALEYWCILSHLNIYMQALGINRFNCLVNSVYITLTSNLSHKNIIHKHSKTIGNVMEIIFTASSRNWFFIISFRLFQWPYCDGSHGAHNKECGDNLGPVVLKRNPEKK